MCRFWPRLWKTVLPVAVLCGGVGLLYTVAAGAYSAGEGYERTLWETLAWRLPLTSALWGGGVILIVEFFHHLWEAKKPAEKSAALSPDAEAEKLLLQLLEQAEEAERMRECPRPLTDTPPPAALPNSRPVATP